MDNNFSKDKYNAIWDTIKDLINEDGLIDDELIGEDDYLSVFVLSNCTKEVINGKLYFRLVKEKP